MHSDLEFRYKSLDNDELLMIVHSLSYRPDAQEMARALLLQRGMSDAAIKDWRDPAIEPIVPSSYGILSETKLKRVFKYHRLVDRGIVYLIFFYVTFWPFIELAEAPYRLLTDEIYRSLWLFEFLSFLVSLCSSLYLIIFTLLIYSFLHGILWRKPLQILLLRPFEYSQNRKQIRRFAKRYLRYLGHTYTLTDSVVKLKPSLLESLQLFCAFFFSHWLLLCFRPYFEVHWVEEIPKMNRFISRRVSRNIAWGFSWDKLFKISCTHWAWKQTMQHLINTVHLIVIDLSHGGEGIQWEIEEIRFYGATDKVVFITHEDNFDSAVSFLRSSALPELEKGLFVYGDDGLAGRHEHLMDKLISIAASYSTGNNSLQQDMHD